MNKRLSLFLHVAFWAFMFLSPLSYMRGHGVTLTQYLMNCMMPLLMMVVFYANYLWLTPRLFVAGKHSYFLIINLVIVVSLGIGLHYWMDFACQLYQPKHSYSHIPMALDELFFILRDIINLGIFAAVGTALVLGQRWQHNDQARREAEAARIDAELSNLRSQINPHFLLNTLNNIYALTAIDHTRAQSAIQQLSNMLRHMLYDNQEQLVSLTDEVKFLENYVSLMKIRLPKTVDVKLEKDIENPNAKVAPLLFISLVENAFKHGVSSTEPSFIHMSMTQKGDSLCVIIENSNFPKSEKDRSGHGIGLQQVQRRLDLAYYEQYEWTKGVNDDGTIYSSTIKIKL